MNFVTGETRVTRREARRAKGRPPCRGLLLLALTLIAAILAVSAASASAAPGRQLGIRPAIPSGSSNLGALTGSTQINATVALTPRDPAALAAYAQAVSTPGSSVYHQYLSVAQFAQQFGATPSDIAAVRSSLASHGLTVGSVTANGLSIGIGGSASKIGGTFSTSFRRYRLRSGREVFANTSAPTVASNLAARVQGVFGLNTLPQAQPQGLEQAHATGGQDTPSLDASTTADTPCPSATSEGNADLAYTANQIASAYGLDNLYGQGDVGAGATVALYELEPFTSSDIKQYQKCYGTQAVITTTPVDGGPINPQIGEAALDIEDVIGLAPKAAINVYQGPNNSQGQFDTYQAMIADDTAQVISTSWGMCEQYLGQAAAGAENMLFEEAATQGQTIFAAAGDHGADDCQTGQNRAVDDPASQPFVTGVGGTSLELPLEGSPQSEVVWNDSPGGHATGGGVSMFWPQPNYQKPVALSQSSIKCFITMTTACREVPDVSADADPDTGYVIFYDGEWLAYGGTSAAAPTWAALAALADVSSTCAAPGTTLGFKPIGFANPALYQAAADGYASNFNDVTSGSNSFDGVTGYRAQSGYDMASGLGTPNAGALVPALCGDNVTVTPPGSQTGAVGSPASVIVTGQSSAGTTLTYSATGLPNGLSIDPSTGLISGTPTTAGTFTVTVAATDAAGSVGNAVFNWSVTSGSTTTTTTTTTTPTTPTSTTTTTTPSPPPPPPPHVTITAPAAQNGQVRAPVQLAVQATDSRGFALSYSATGLPVGLSINAGNGVISGTPRRAGATTVQVSVSDGHGGSATAVLSWNIARLPRVTHAKLRPAPRHTARLSLSLTTSSPLLAIKQVKISDAGGPLRFPSSLAKVATATARSAHAARVATRVAGRRTSATFSYAAASRGTASLTLPLKLLGPASRHRRVRVKVVIVDAAGVQATVSLRLAL